MKLPAKAAPEAPRRGQPKPSAHKAKCPLGLHRRRRAQSTGPSWRPRTGSVRDRHPPEPGGHPRRHRGGARKNRLRLPGRAAFSVLDNGHTVQVNVAPGNTSGRAWGGASSWCSSTSTGRARSASTASSSTMVAHLVHKDADGRLAVVAVLLEQRPRRQGPPRADQSVWNNLPLEKGEALPAPGPAGPEPAAARATAATTPTWAR